MASQVGEAVIKLTFDGKSVKASLNQVESTVEKSGKSSGSKWAGTWAVTAGNLLAKGISKVASMVTSTMGSAIQRLDTLKNFPEVMTSLGYSAEEADKSITMMSDGLDGLPTKLDTMTNDVQKLAATMGNLADGEVNATTVGLGLNDMFLASGKGTEAASAGMEAYNKMLAVGKVDMEHWTTLVNSAPGQMDELAKTLVGATANQADLYQAMKEGTITLDDFNSAIVRLDQEGGDGFASFNQQAIKATQGLGTQIENVQTSLTKVVAAALDGNLEDMDKYINQLNDRIQALVPTLVEGFTGALGVLLTNIPGMVVELVPVVMDAIVDLVDTIVQATPQLVQAVFEIMMALSQAIMENLPLIMDSITQLLNSLVEAFPVIIPALIQALTNLIILIAQQLTRPDFLSALLKAAITLLLEIVKAIPPVLTALIGALPQIIDNILAFLLDPANLAMIIDAAIQLFLGIVMAVPQILGALLGAFGTLVGNLWNGITSMFGQFASDFGTFIGDIFKGAINGMIAFIENFINAPIDLINGFLGIINDAFGWLGVHIDPIARINLPRLATGGVVDSATTAIIGEDGQEAVLPLENNTGNWAGLLAETLATEMKEQGTGGAGINVYMTNQISNRLDAEEIGRVMIQSIRRAS